MSLRRDSVRPSASRNDDLRCVEIREERFQFGFIGNDFHLFALFRDLRIVVSGIEKEIIDFELPPRQVTGRT